MSNVECRVTNSPFVIRHSSFAMTLVEMLVVLGIIGVIIGISVPGLAGYAMRLRLKTATRQAAGLIFLARSTAISTHEDHAVVIDPDAREIRVVAVGSGEVLEQHLRLPASVTVELQVGGQPATESQFVFRSTGSLTGRSVSVVLTDHERQQFITVIGATGAISVQ